MPSTLRGSLILPLLAWVAACGVTDPTGTDPYANRAVSIPVLAFGTLAATDVSAGAFHTCIAQDSGQAWCSGANTDWQLGTATTGEQCDSTPCAKVPSAVSSPVALAHLYAGTTHSCALTPAGTAWCWGRPYPADSVGPLGGGAVQSSATPVAVAGALIFRSLAVSIAESCGLTTDGTAYCWGRNRHGEVGDGTTIARRSPVAVATPLRFSALASGGTHSCGIDASGSAYCWGMNDWGQLGNGAATSPGASASTPVAVAGGLAFAQIAGGGAFTCALTSTGAAYCWGANTSGQLGIASSATLSAVPARVAGGMTFVAITAGSAHACGLRADGQAYCWGNDYFGSLGDNGDPFTDQHAPVKVLGGPYAAISAGGSHTCALTPAHAVYCWGDRFFGQQGTG